DEGGSIGGAPIEKRRIWVAKDTIPPGTKITDVEKYFAAKDWPADSVAPNVIDKDDELRGRVVATTIPANLPPTKEAFLDPGVNPGVPKTPAVVAQDPPKDNTARHTITIQVAGGAPSRAHYENGKLVDTSGPTPGVSPGSQEIKPEKKGEDKPEKS